MKEVLELIKNTEALLSQAEKNIQGIEKSGTEQTLKQVRAALNKRRELSDNVAVQKQIILQILIQISLAANINRYDKVDALGRDYWIREYSGGGLRIGYSESPHSQETDICGFVGRSRDTGKDALDFDAFCLAILVAATQYLKDGSQKISAESTGLSTLCAKLRANCNP